jgi:hypothetical protein
MDAPYRAYAVLRAGEEFGAFMMGFECVRVRAGWLALVICIGAACAAIGGCQNRKPDAPEQPAAPPPSPERIAEIRRAEGWLVGEVEAVDTEGRRAAVGGIDPKLVNRMSVFLLLDSSTGEVINDGSMYSTTPSGRIIVTFDGGRTAPKQGDLAAVRKANP